MPSSTFDANKEARLSVLVRGARLRHTSKACYSPYKYTARRHPKLTIGYRLAKPCFVCSECSSSGRPVCNRWLILSASPRRFSSGSYEVRCVPVSDSEYYTKSDGFSGKIVGRSRWFSISLRPLRSLRQKHIVTERPPQARKSL